MTFAAAHEPPFALDGTVTAAKLRELLAVQTELTWLDYKEECDISDARGRVEIAKDVGAMMIQGGYLVIGADNSGTPIGLPVHHAKLFDQATLSHKLASYLPQNSKFVLPCTIWRAVTERPRSLRSYGYPRTRMAGAYLPAMASTWKAAGLTLILFRQGDVYARHGSRSERWDQTDVGHARRLLIARQKDNWRAEMADERQRVAQAVSAQTAAVTGPAATFNWQADAAAFEAAAVELMRRDDDVPVRRMLRSAQADALGFLDLNNAADQVTILDRVTTVAALGLELARRPFFDMAVALMLELYESSLTGRASQHAGLRSLQQFWLRIAERLYALGALAVRESDWWAVRAIATASVPSLEMQSRNRTWHRHALTQASRTGLLEEPVPAGGMRPISLLLFARAVAVTNPALRPDLPGELESESSRQDRLLVRQPHFAS